MKTLLILTTVFAVVAISPAADPSKRRPAVTDPAKADADADFKVQGEYAGTLGAGTGKKAGVQVIAAGYEGGPGTFIAVAYAGGLPGDGWDGKKRSPTKGRTEGGATTFPALELPGFQGTARIAGGALELVDAKGEVRGKLEKVERKSPTLGAKPPEGAVVLFDGKTNQFAGQGVEGDLLREGETSEAKHGDCKVHVEFRTPYMPDHTGQDRGNSGVYLQSRYEVQVLDSFGLEGADNECGGIYSVAKPKVNMCLPPLAWQTYDIEFTAARFDDAGKKTRDATMTVRHNGVLIHDNVRIDHTTTAAPEKLETSTHLPLYLQDHGSPVRYRNIWAVPK